jgi:hypothetical protein
LASLATLRLSPTGAVPVPILVLLRLGSLGPGLLQILTTAADPSSQSSSADDFAPASRLPGGLCAVCFLLRQLITTLFYSLLLFIVSPD